MVHPGVLSGLLSGLFGIAPDHLVAAATASLTVLRVSTAGRVSGGRLELFNDSPAGLVLLAPD